MIIKAGDPTGDVPAPTVRTILRTIRDAEVIFIGFPRLQRAFIVDFRTNDGHHPGVFIAMLGYTAEQQLQALQAARPDLPPIEQFVTMPWGGSTRAFAEQGILPAILGRLPAHMTPETIAVFEQLRAVERSLMKPDRSVGPSRSTEKIGEDNDEEHDDQGIANLSDDDAMAPGS